MSQQNRRVTPIMLEDVHYRLLTLINARPEGISVAELVAQMMARGWCDPGTTAEDLGFHPQDILKPRAPANEP